MSEPSANWKRVTSGRLKLDTGMFVLECRLPDGFVDSEAPDWHFTIAANSGHLLLADGWKPSLTSAQMEAERTLTAWCSQVTKAIAPDPRIARVEAAIKSARELRTFTREEERLIEMVCALFERAVQP